MSYNVNGLIVLTPCYKTQFFTINLCPSVLLSVRPSVCLSQAWIVTKRKKDLSRFLYHTKDHLALFTDKKNGWWGATTSTWNFGSTGPRWSKIADFEPIIARSASAVTLSEKSSINTNRKSTTRFPMSLRWSSYVAPKSSEGGLKNATRTFSVKKSHFAWRKSATKRPLIPEILEESDRFGAKSLIFDIFSLVATQP